MIPYQLIIFCSVAFFLEFSLPTKIFSNQKHLQKLQYQATFLAITVGASCCINVNEAQAKLPINPLNVGSDFQKVAKEIVSKQSPGWELARQKRTAAIKSMEEKGMLQIRTDDSGNQFLMLPWLPNQSLPYKSLSISDRLRNEVFAGAFGEIAKDCILHPVDTAKTRRQAKKKSKDEIEKVNEHAPSNSSIFTSIKELYSGFPIVLTSSIPQGSAFFLMKRGTTELLNLYFPAIPKVLSASIPICAGVVSYWAFRTPAEVIKTKVQTGMSPTVMVALQEAKDQKPKGLLSLYKHYSVMLWLDIPFQIVNFILYGLLSDFLLTSGYETSIGTRLFCGITCGMISAAFTCPIDTCKTRMIGRDRAAAAAAAASSSGSDPFNKSITSTLPTQSEEEAPINTLLKESLHHDELQSCSSDGDEILLDIHTKNINNRQQYQIQNLSDKEEINFVESITVGSDIKLPFNSKNESPLLSSEITPPVLPPPNEENNSNVIKEIIKIAKTEGPLVLFSGIKQRLLYTGLANGIRLAVYGTARMDLMMKSLDNI